MKIKSVKTNTFPLIVHAPGYTDHCVSDAREYHRLNPFWEPILEQWARFEALDDPTDSARELTIFTWNTSEKKGILELSLDRLGIPYVTLARGVRNWRRVDKLKHVLESFAQVKTPYVMGLDCYDVLVLRHLGEAIEKFKTFGCDLLFNGERYYYPDYDRTSVTGKTCVTSDWKTFQSSVSEGPWQFLNGGAWIGTTDFCRTFIEACYARNIESLIASGALPPDHVDFIEKSVDNEQVMLHWLFTDFYPRVQVDTRAEIFLNTCRVPRFPRELELYRSFHQIPFSEWVATLADFTLFVPRRISRRAIDASRPLRHRFRLRRSQWI